MILDDSDIAQIKYQLFDSNYESININTAQVDALNINDANVRESIRIEHATTMVEMWDGTIYTGQQLAYLLNKLNIICKEKFPEDFV